MSRVLRAMGALPVKQMRVSDCGVRRQRLVFLTLQWRQLSSKADTTRGFEEGWTKDTIPNPTDPAESSQCGGHVPLNGTSFLCNPDYILSPKAALKVHGMLNAIQKEVKLTCREVPEGEHVQVAVVVINNMKPTMMFYGRVQLDSAQAAEQLAQALHDKWGVGHATSQSGALLLLSVSDRQMYLSKGQGLGKRITERSVRVLLDQHMAPALKEGRYDDAVLRGVRQLRLMVAGKARDGEGGYDGSSGGGSSGGGSGSHSQNGSSNNAFKMLKPLGGFMVLAILFNAVVTSMERQEEERKKHEWEQCRTKLDRISREREQRLMAVDQGSDALPPSDTCPMCLGDFTGNAAAGGGLMGVDGKPAVTLACSHSFCSECLTQTETCPICLSDATTPAEMGESGTLPPEDQKEEQRREERMGETHRPSRSAGARWWFPRSTNRPASDRATADRSKKLASVRKETSFRLKRLQEQHPGIISEKQVDEWKNTRDRKGFTMPPPPQPKRPSPEEEKKFRSNESSGSFGGGRTSGGHGGSW